MKSLKYKEFLQFLQEKDQPLSMTGNEAIFAEELINAIEDSKAFKQVMTTIGGRKHIFEKIHEFYRETNK